jgi:DNA-binding transcriptional MocR family regulator
VQSYRSFSSGWSSRLLQAAAAFLLNDPATTALVAQARDVYAMRRDALAARLVERGIDLPSSDGLCLWIPVAAEQFALVTLAAHGIAVLPGSKCSTRPIARIRLATCILKDRYDYVADAVALAAGIGAPNASGP